MHPPRTLQEIARDAAEKTAEARLGPLIYRAHFVPGRLDHVADAVAVAVLKAAYDVASQQQHRNPATLLEEMLEALLASVDPALLSAPETTPPDQETTK